ncbi:hypothetical protein KYG_00932 [Acidovorax sp. NO-1]|uniref:hypothetical protein n=1 Tax=Acidovorax sp. NO-1 TaxID=512030 RepID=UPI00023FCD86|nr:hypothetical protein [Acidovorax sp. NO-1]EHL24834.1 hypothetical protein KYG_00932 [Acidovorax sp. NO-1]
MNTLSISSPFAHLNVQDSQTSSSDPYASAAQSAAVLRSGAQFRRNRMDAADMVSTDEAALLAGTSRVTINAWIKSRRCIGVSNLRRGFKLPSWQFEPNVWPVLQPLAAALGAKDGWQMLAFLETPSLALHGLTPRAALEQGVPGKRILALATAEAH